ncbi:hypothetical protein [Xenorhabdus sp. BG5]|uniref:hypothetical protein n=1 Tax=Xenorhabdus sp. BG5 TaxID=2782014 RepID=UPI00187E7179|nr:hypothetical protein [Xenorhabdus sp. BG5]MBE8597699.1 hypothetical protein [Xenorhabdus sp. BG5]
MNTYTHKAILHTAFTTGQKNYPAVEAEFYRNISYMTAELEPWFKNVTSGSRDFSRIRVLATVLLTGATGYVHQILRNLIGIGFLPATLSKSFNMEAVSWND